MLVLAFKWLNYVVIACAISFNVGIFPQSAVMNAITCQNKHKLF